ncbi:MAG: hypothetical protein MJ238_06215, partial [Bacilli bacterium]|nr:hypothetical protein [Bacilli bacterium]
REGKCLVAAIGYERCYEYVEHRGLLNIFTLKKKTILKKVKEADPESLGEYGQYYQYHSLKKKKE